MCVRVCVCGVWQGWGGGWARGVRDRVFSNCLRRSPLEEAGLLPLLHCGSVSRRGRPPGEVHLGADFFWLSSSPGKFPCPVFQTRMRSTPPGAESAHPCPRCGLCAELSQKPRAASGELPGRVAPTERQRRVCSGLDGLRLPATSFCSRQSRGPFVHL